MLLEYARNSCSITSSPHGPVELMGLITIFFSERATFVARALERGPENPRRWPDIVGFASMLCCLITPILTSKPLHFEF